MRLRHIHNRLLSEFTTTGAIAARPTALSPDFDQQLAAARQDPQQVREATIQQAKFERDFEKNCRDFLDSCGGLQALQQKWNQHLAESLIREDKQSLSAFICGLLAPFMAAMGGAGVAGMSGAGVAGMSGAAVVTGVFALAAFLVVPKVMAWLFEAGFRDK